MTPQHWRLAVVAELVLGAILGSLFLGTHSLFLDESVSATLATAPWHRFANVVTHREANMALYYLLLRGWVVFGHSEVALRSLSVILAVGALWVVIVLGARLVRPACRAAGGVAARGEPARRPVRPGRPRLLPGAPARQRLLLLLRPWCPTGRTRRPGSAGRPTRGDRPGGLQQFLGCAGARRAGALAGLPATGADPVAPHPAVGDRADRAAGPARFADRIHRQCRSQLGLWLLGRPPVHPHPFVGAARRPRRGRPDCGRHRGRRRLCWRGAGLQIGAVFARQWPLFFTAVLARCTRGRRGDALAGRQAAPRRALPDGQPSRRDPAGRVGVDRVASLARAGAASSAAVLLVIVVGASAVGAAEWYSKGGPQDFRPAVAFIADQAQPGDGVLDLRALRADSGRVVHGGQTGHRTRSCTPSTRRRHGASTRCTSTGACQCRRAPSSRPRPSTSASGSSAPRPTSPCTRRRPQRSTPRSAAPGSHPAGTTHFRGVEVTEEVRQ